MASRIRLKTGQRVGPYELLRHLGSGGNAEVWEGIDKQGRKVAVKVLSSRRPNSEPYKRFRDEVHLLRSLGSRRGLLPVIDAYLPESAASQDYPWLAMPVAISIRVALGEAPELVTVVRATAAIAETLSSLSQEGISHRDIKPSNLYYHEGEWVIGDFGLADYPEKEAITADGRKLGPLYFIAPEMLADPVSADGCVADVYSLAKTFWVLATGQNYPPQGEHRVDNANHRLGNFVSHQGTIQLDHLLESATKDDPVSRLAMFEVVSELNAWLSPAAPTTSPQDMSDLIAKISHVAEPGRRADVLRQRWIGDSEMVLERLGEKLQPIAALTAETGRGAGTIVRNVSPYSLIMPQRSKYSKRMRPTEPGKAEGDLVWVGSLSNIIKSPGDMYQRFEMYCDVFAVLFKGGWIEIAAGYTTAPRDLPHGCSGFGRYSSALARLGSAELDRAIDALGIFLAENLRPALAHFADLLEASLWDASDNDGASQKN